MCVVLKQSSNFLLLCCFGAYSHCCSTDCVCVCFRLAEERIAREIAESRLHMLEDQLAELQEELRRVSENSSHSDSMQTVRTLHSYACTNKLTIAPT